MVWLFDVNKWKKEYSENGVIYNSKTLYTPCFVEYPQDCVG